MAREMCGKGVRRWFQAHFSAHPNHRSITVATDVPKGTDLSKHSEEDLMRIQRSLNGRPPATLDYKMPVEKLAEFVALTS
jgi:hypothetical protein